VMPRPVRSKSACCARMAPSAPSCRSSVTAASVGLPEVQTMGGPDHLPDAASASREGCREPCGRIVRMQFWKEEQLRGPANGVARSARAVLRPPPTPIGTHRFRPWCSSEDTPVVLPWMRQLLSLRCRQAVRDERRSPPRSVSYGTSVLSLL
jgi:hypothetical protein